MRSPDEIDFDQFYNDWRHRDRLTWEIPSIVAVIGGALIIGAYWAAIEWWVRALAFGLALFFVSTLGVMLAQNLYYQWRDEKHLGTFGRQKLDWPRSRPIPPPLLEEKIEKEKDCFCTKLGRIVGFERMGSSLLLMSCLFFSLGTGVLFVIEFYNWRGLVIAILVGVVILLIPFGWFLKWLIWDWKKEES